MPSAALIGGTAAAAAAAACFDGAVLLQAGEARTVGAEHALRPSLIRELAARRRWLAGTALAVLGVPLQLLALSAAPVTLVQPALALGLVLLLALGGRVLGERVGPADWAAAAAVIGGVALLVASAPEHRDHLAGGAAPWVAVGTLAAATAACFALGARRAGGWGLIAGAGSAFALAAVAAKLVTIELARGRPLAALGWALAGAAASASGFLIDMSALQRHPATRVAPPMFVLETALPVALAPALFGEHWSAATVAALLLVLAGGALLGRRRTATARQD